MKLRPNPFFPEEPKPLSRELGVLWRELATTVNALILAYTGNDSTGGGGSGNNRWGSGVDTTDDIIIDDSDSGLVLRSPDGDYWRVQIDNTGALVTTNLGTTKP